MKEHFILSNYLKASKTFGIYGELFSQMSLNHSYLATEIPTKEMGRTSESELIILSQFFEGFRNNPRAASIVVSNPFKQVVTEFCDSLEPSASQMNTVNLIIKRNGKLVGKNIDGDAFFTGQRETIGFDFGNKTVLLLGCGGVSTAVAFKLANEGVGSIQLFDTFPQKKEDLARKLRSSFPNLLLVVLPQITSESIAQTNVVYNGTGVGKKSDNPASLKESPLPEEIDLPSGVLAIDANYTPWKTRFLQQFEQAGSQTLNGFPHMIAFIALHLSEILDVEVPFDEVKKVGERNL